MNIKIFKDTVFSFMIFSVIVISITGCQTAGNTQIKRQQVIKPGDKVQVDFTCRLGDGELVMTTDEVTAKDEKETKSGIFLPLTEYYPVPMVAGSGSTGPDYGKLKSLENEIFEQLSLVVVGMENGSKRNIELKAQDSQGLSEEERYLKMSRVRRQAKIVKSNPVAFKRSQGKDPVEGDVITSEAIKGVSMTVISVTDREVVIELTAEEGTEVSTALGRAQIQDAGDHYETVIDIHEGQLIRSGVIVGRVTKIEGDMFTVDYGNPFGGETLICDVIAKTDKKENER